MICFEGEEIYLPGASAVLRNACVCYQRLLAALVVPGGLWEQEEEQSAQLQHGAQTLGYLRGAHGRKVSAQSQDPVVECGSLPLQHTPASRNQARGWRSLLVRWP